MLINCEEHAFGFRKAVNPLINQQKT